MNRDNGTPDEASSDGDALVAALGFEPAANFGDLDSPTVDVPHSLLDGALSTGEAGDTVLLDTDPDEVEPDSSPDTPEKEVVVVSAAGINPMSSAEASPQFINPPHEPIPAADSAPSTSMPGVESTEVAAAAATTAAFGYTESLRNEVEQQAAGGTSATSRSGPESDGSPIDNIATWASGAFGNAFGPQRRRVRARKVRRVIRHIDPWSVLTFSVLFHLFVFASMLLASVLVWNAAEAAGTVENLESFIRELGDYKTYDIQEDVIFRAAMLIAGILTLASSVIVVLLTVVFNLISDLIGGIRVTVVEEETVRFKRNENSVASRTPIR